MESEPHSPEGIAERAECRDRDAVVDTMTRRTAELLRSLLPPDIHFVLIVSKEREFYQHQCTASSLTSPLPVCTVLGNALMDLQKLLHPSPSVANDPPQETD